MPGMGMDLEKSQVPEEMEYHTADPFGNCMFESVGSAVGHARKKKAIPYGTVRCELITHLKRHKSDYEAFHDNEDSLGESCGYDGYLAHMLTDKMWGGALEIKAASRHYDVKVVVIPMDAAVPVEVYHPKGKATIYLWYKGDHYDWLSIKEGRGEPVVLSSNVAEGSVRGRRGGGGNNESDREEGQMDYADSCSVGTKFTEEEGGSAQTDGDTFRTVFTDGRVRVSSAHGGQKSLGQHLYGKTSVGRGLGSAGTPLRKAEEVDELDQMIAEAEASRAEVRHPNACRSQFNLGKSTYIQEGGYGWNCTVPGCAYAFKLKVPEGASMKQDRLVLKECWAKKNHHMWNHHTSTDRKRCSQYGKVRMCKPEEMEMKRLAKTRGDVAWRCPFARCQMGYTVADKAKISLRNEGKWRWQHCAKHHAGTSRKVWNKMLLSRVAKPISSRLRRVNQTVGASLANKAAKLRGLGHDLVTFSWPRWANQDKRVIITLSFQCRTCKRLFRTQAQIAKSKTCEPIDLRNWGGKHNCFVVARRRVLDKLDETKGKVMKLKAQGSDGNIHGRQAVLDMIRNMEGLVKDHPDLRREVSKQ
jgi:hypothetical protein